MSDDTRIADRHLIAAQILALQAHRREIQDDLDHLRSLLRNDLAGERWSDEGVKVEFRPGFYKAVPVRRTDAGLVFQRRRLEPYMKVSAK